MWRGSREEKQYLVEGWVREGVEESCTRVDLIEAHKGVEEDDAAVQKALGMPLHYAHPLHVNDRLPCMQGEEVEEGEEGEEMQS